MDYRHMLDSLSQCGLGAALVSLSHIILEINALGDHLLHGEGTLVGKSLRSIAPELCQIEGETLYANIAFGEYLTACPPPKLDLPPNTHMVVFRNATSDACHDMLMSVVNQISEAVILCDAKSRIYLLNDAAVKMDSIVTQDVLGEDIASIYTSRDGTDLTIPTAIDTLQPRRTHRQHYTTY